MVYALEYPNLGFVDADEMDHVRCLEVQRPYLASVECHYTDWTPLKYRINEFEEEDYLVISKVLRRVVIAIDHYRRDIEEY